MGHEPLKSLELSHLILNQHKRLCHLKESHNKSIANPLQLKSNLSLMKTLMSMRNMSYLMSLITKGMPEIALDQEAVTDVFTTL